MQQNFSAKHQHDFFGKFNKYLASDQYEKSALELLQFYKLDPKGPCYQLLTSILFYLEKKHLEKVLSQIQLQLPAPLQKISTSQSLSGPARGKVRYISGYVVAKLKHTISTKLRNCLFVKKMESQIEQLQEQMILLNSLCI